MNSVQYVPFVPDKTSDENKQNNDEDYNDNASDSA